MRLQNVKCRMAVALAAAVLFPTIAGAVRGTSEGNKPVENRSWPTGTEGVVNLPSRLRYQVGPASGEYRFEFQCQDTEEFNEALALFGKIRVPRIAAQPYISTDGRRMQIGGDGPHLLIVHDWPPPGGGRGSIGIRGGKLPPLVWTFLVWTPEGFHRWFSGPRVTAYSHHPNSRQPVPAPQIDVYVGGDGPIVWEQVKVPPNVRVIDKRAAAAPMETSKGGVVRGGVFDMCTHQVIAGADVVLRKREGRDWKDVARTKTDEAGRYEIREIPRGDYAIHIRADEHVARSVGSFDNRSGHAWRDADSLLASPAGIAGVVVGTDGKPIAGAKVRVREVFGLDGRAYYCADDPTATTEENGRFVLVPVPDGYGRLRCTVPGMHQESPPGEFCSLSSRTHERRDDVKIVMSGTGIVRGKVVDEKGEPPTRGFNVRIEPEGGSKVGGWSGSARLKDDGSFEFKGVTPGKYTLIARPNPGSSRETTRREVTVEVGKTVEIEIPNDYAHEN